MPLSTLSASLPLPIPEREEQFWTFVQKRQRMFALRAMGINPPWTGDPILASHRFTNVYRAADRVSQYLIRNVLYDDVRPRDTLAFRAVLFRMFNLIETWEMLTARLGESPTLSNWNWRLYRQFMDEHIAHGGKLWTGAYMVTPPVFSYGHHKHHGWLQILDDMVQHQAFHDIQRSQQMTTVYSILRSYPTVGDFFAYQWTVDINYSLATDFDEDAFVVAGGGALRGLEKLYGRKVNPQEAIRYLTETQTDHLPLSFPWLGGSRKLHLIDVQNALCEWDKYTRESNPEYQRSAYFSRIKQKFDPIDAAKHEPIEFFWPPKWGLPNAAI